MRREYENWLRSQGYGEGTIVAQLHRVGRVEEHYGDLDTQFDRDGLNDLLKELTYSVADERRRRPNPSKIPFVGNARNNLASYKSAVRWYARFRANGSPSTVGGEAWPNVERTSFRADALREQSASSTSRGHLTNRSPKLAPSLVALGDDTLPLVRIAAKHCLLPHPNVVKMFGCAVFPAIRDQRARLTLSEVGGRQVLLDDNVTARWALLWSHGIPATHHLTGFTFAHVWGAVKDPGAYTHIANLAMMPEFLASLSDKDGPFAEFLRFHAWTKYGWRPDGYPEPPQPGGFEEIEWRYLEDHRDGLQFVRDRLATLSNQRTTLLNPIMESTGWWGRANA